VQFHLLSFEGPDPYARAGGLASRVTGLAETLAGLGFETHLWFVGDPRRPGHQREGRLHLHRWCQWLSRHHLGGVYEGEEGKAADFASSLPPYLLQEALLPHLRSGGRAVVLAEEWQTAHAVLHLDHLLERAGRRSDATLAWNANNVFGFARIPWEALTRAAMVTTVSRYMKARMREIGIEPFVVPNGLSADAFESPERPVVQALRRRFRDRTTLVKMARFDPDKRWLAAIDLVAELKRLGWRPLLVARGGNEAHGREVLTAARARGLRVSHRPLRRARAEGVLEALGDPRDADVLNLSSNVDAAGRRTLFRAVDAVLANSGHEPFGLVGLETMAAGGLACTGSSGEDYAIAGQNALVLETGDPCEFITLFRSLRAEPHRERRLRLSGRATARRFAWSEVIAGVLLPRVAASGFRCPKGRAT
jgi:glycosyltransferase involved in cell wall biosynthesis